MCSLPLFAAEPVQPSEQIGENAYIFRGFALAHHDALLADLRKTLQSQPFRTMVTPGGHTMSVKLSCCGTYGWVSDSRGYRYTRTHPATGNEWPPMPASFLELAACAARRAGFHDYQPDSCLINRYVPGARLTLHQDKDEKDSYAPIVSVSLGLPALFLFGGFHRNDKTRRYPVFHGDVVVWGAADRLRFHGVLPVKEGVHAVMGPQRINLTFRVTGL